MSHDTVLCLSANPPDKPVTKVITVNPDGTVKAIRPRVPTRFSAREVPVSDLASLSNLLTELENDFHSIVVRGALKNGADPHDCFRRKVGRRADNTGNIEEHPRHWLMIDVDGIALPEYDASSPLPPGLDPTTDPDSVISAVLDLLPSSFSRSSCHWQFSASQGFKENGSISLHLWFWLDNFYSDDQLKRYFEAFNVSFMQNYHVRLVDTVVYDSIQVHYTAGPIIEGSDDPLPVRSGLYINERPEAHLSEEFMSETENKDRYGSYLNRIGDDKDGFHWPIMQAIASWITEYGDPTPQGRRTIKDVVKATVQSAQLSPKRSKHEIERYCSDPFIDALIDGAIAKGFGNKAKMPLDLTDILNTYYYVSSLHAFVNPEKPDLVYPPEVIHAMHAHEVGTNNLAKELYKHPSLRRVDITQPVPGHEEPVVTDGGITILNTWQGHDIDPSPDARNVNPFLDHIRYLVDFDDEGYRHMCSFIAHVISRPGIKINHALIIGSSLQGTGKSYIHWTLQKILGKKNYVIVDTDALKEQYNSWIAGCELVCVEELMADGRLSMANTLKPMITQDDVKIRRMRTDSYNARNYANFIATTNHFNAMTLSQGERRYWVWFSRSAPKSPDYYNRLFEWTFNNLDAIVRWAKDYDLSGFDPKARPPITQHTQEMMNASKAPLTSYIHEQIETYSWPFNGDLVVVSDLMDALRSKGFGRLSTVKVTNELKEFGAECLGQVRFPNGERPRVWVIRNFDEWREVKANHTKDIAKEYVNPNESRFSVDF